MSGGQSTQQLFGGMAPPSSAAMPSAATAPRLDDFEKVRELGRGGNAVVYEAIWKGTNQHVALKVIHGELITDPKFIVRFRREVRAASLLQHPNICRVHAFGEEDKTLWLAMELIDGGSVRDLIDRAGRLPPQVAALLVTQWLSALGAAHAAGILHRDIKPANAMVTSAGALKLVDFGIAKAADDATVTETGFLVGTPAYMSPEQAIGQPVDERMDLYAVGVSLFEMLAGENPYAHETPQGALLKIASHPLPSLFEQDPTIPGAVESVLEHLTERHPDDRVRHAADAVVELRPYVDYVEDVHPGLMRAFVQDPAGVGQMLNQERAELERARAEHLLLGGDANLPAAGLALYRASLLWRQADVLERLQVVCGRGSLRFGAPDDEDLRKAREVHEASPGQAGPVKRVADLYRARGDMHRFVVYVRRYLRLRPGDSHARQQLEVAVAGSATADLGANGRLKTHDILAGVKTGGWAAAPDARKEAALRLQQPTLSSLSARKPVVNAMAATAVVRSADPKVGAGPSPASPEARIREAAQRERVTPGAVGGDESFLDVLGQVWEAWGRRLIAVALVLAAFALVLRFTSKSVEVAVDTTQMAISDNAAAVGAIERNDIARRQKNLLDDAVGHFNADDHLKVVVDVNNLLALTPPADLALSGMLLRARSRARLNQREAARRDYDEFIKQTPLTDPRRAEAMNELNLLVVR